MTGRTALVTGGTKGIGRAIALRLAADGFAATAVYRGDEAGREETQRLAQEKGLTLAFERADLTQPQEVSALFSRLKLEPDVLVHAAGKTHNAPFVFTGPADFDAMIDANLRSAFLVCQQGAKAMVRKKFGRILLLTSPAALLGNEGQAAYSAAKAGLLGLTRTLARELARYALTVNAVCPGVIDTEMSADLDPEKKKQLASRIPLRRTGKPDDVAGMVHMLCAEQAGYITGQCIAVDGGLT
ncbi:MAG: SDR family NAD(P)-dependent oxidoreductase [Myxococcaceae bacterium]